MAGRFPAAGAGPRGGPQHLGDVGTDKLVVLFFSDGTKPQSVACFLNEDTARF